ncbi:MAG: TIGR03089 family protein, partial [Mycobacteriaceae bacterium]
GLIAVLGAGASLVQVANLDEALLTRRVQVERVTAVR